MADPLSALGAVAAASQLAQQCLSITLFLCSVRSKIRNSREMIDSQAQQVEHLTRLCRQIISNPSLQTQTIANVLKACLLETEALHRVLQEAMISSKDRRVVRCSKIQENIHGTAEKRGD